MNEARTVSVSIARTADEVYEYLTDATHLPHWSDFITAVEPDGDGWLATTSQGITRMRFVPRNEFRVLDHRVTVSPGLEVYVPMRVLENGAAGSEVIFTVFHLPGMTGAEFEADIQLVRTDLAKLKRVLETP